MDIYNNLIIMLKEKETGFFVQTLGSYEIHNNMEYIDKIFAVKESETFYLYLTLTTFEIDEDWKYSGILDLYNHDVFSDRICGFSEISGDYNPKWELKIKYSLEDKNTQELLNEIVNIHEAELKRITPLINQEDYTEDED